MNYTKIPSSVLMIALTLVVTASAFGQNKTPKPRRQITPEQQAAREAKRAEDDARRLEIPLGGDFQPDPKDPVLVAVGHGMNIVMSRDDGKTWKQVFFGNPAGDHGLWASSSIAYTQGVFVAFGGWGSAGRGSWIASEDGVRWRHLAGADRKGRHDPQSMNDTFDGAGGNGAFVGVGTSMESTTDFGKTWNRATTRDFDPRPKTHHMRVIFADYKGGRFMVVGDGPNLFYSDDLGKTWTHSKMIGLGDYVQGLGRSLAYNQGVFLLLGGNGDFAWRSIDGGETWEKHVVGAERVATHGTSVSVVDGDFWVTGQKSRASEDGIVWRDLPSSTPVGRIVQSDQSQSGKGTYISVNRRRHNILRSTNGVDWKDVYNFTPDERAHGGRQGFNEVVFGRANSIDHADKTRNTESSTR